MLGSDLQAELPSFSQASAHHDQGAVLGIRVAPEVGSIFPRPGQPGVFDQIVAGDQLGQLVVVLGGGATITRSSTPARVVSRPASQDRNSALIGAPKSWGSNRASTSSRSRPAAITLWAEKAITASDRPGGEGTTSTLPSAAGNTPCAASISNCPRRC